MNIPTTTVTQDKWNAGGISGTDIDGFIFQPFRMINNKIYKGSCYGMKFKTSEEMWEFAFVHGYTKPFYRRRWCDACHCMHSFLKRDCPNRFKIKN